MKFFHLQSLLLLFTSVCTAQVVQNFINCGSSTNITTNNGQTFVGDEDTNIVTFLGADSTTVKTTNKSDNSSESIFQTARVFRKPSSYSFDIPQSGTYFIRLHFCAFTSSLSDAKFNVSTSSKLMLLSDFPPGKSSTNCSSTSPREFLLSISNSQEKFSLYFVPASSSFAFVNAIEFFSTTSNITRVSVPYVTAARSAGEYNGKSSEVFETIYRINVGGTEVQPSSFSLWRTWIPDDQYLINKGDAQNAPDKSSSITYDNTLATSDDAPQPVYGSAKVLRTTWNSSLIPNLTWQFNVENRSEYFVRVHFCDIISPGNGPYNFTFYIYSNFSEVIDPYEITGHTDTPFYKDYVVGSNDLGFINISVGSNNASGSRTYMFLNGVEIMRLSNETATVPVVAGNPNRSRLVLIVSLVVSGIVFLVFVAALLVYLRQRKKKKPIEVSEWEMLAISGVASSRNRTSESASSHASTFQNLQLGLKIPFAEIQRVTNNFDANLIIGEGGFGKVYKGTLRSGLKVAVKRGTTDHGQGMAEFQTEIMILSKIRHRHLVSLIGYCYESNEMILVYEFMEKGTLREHLYDSRRGPSTTTNMALSWKQRLEICIGAAKGIQYLHTGTNTGIIHRDVKSTNILLDEKFVAKVADFGLSRSGFLDQSHVSISDVKGTLGYLDPEYVICLQLTEKSDVYAFGVVLLEALCARPVIDSTLSKEEINLPERAMACYEGGEIEKIIDPLIVNEINPNSLKKFCETVERCLRKNAEERPPMSDVCWGLEYALQLQKSAADARAPLDDTITDASLNMPLPAIWRYPSQSVADFEYNDESLNTDTGEVFSQLKFDDNVGR